MGDTEGVPPPGWRVLEGTPAPAVGILPARPSRDIPGASVTSAAGSGHRRRTRHAAALHGSATRRLRVSPERRGHHPCPPAQGWGTAPVEPPAAAVPGAPTTPACPSLGPAPDDLLENEPKNAPQKKKKKEKNFARVVQRPEEVLSCSGTGAAATWGNREEGLGREEGHQEVHFWVGLLFEGTHRSATKEQPLSRAPWSSLAACAHHACTREPTDVSAVYNGMTPTVHPGF